MGERNGFPIAFFTAGQIRVDLVTDVGSLSIMCQGLCG